MQEEWEKYLLSKVELQSLPKSNKKKAKTPKGFGILDGVIPSVSGQKSEFSSISKHENDALLAAAYEISKLAKVDADAKEGVNENCGEGKKNKRSKKKAILDMTDPESAATPSEHEGLVNDCRIPVASQHLDRMFLRKHDQGSEDTNQLVHFHTLESEQSILEILQPSVIVLYHPDMAFVREIEVYKSENPSKRLKVYFLFYEESTEVQKYEASVRRENGAFESLIRQKSVMMIPVSQVCYFALVYCS